MRRIILALTMFATPALAEDVKPYCGMTHVLEEQIRMYEQHYQNPMLAMNHEYYARELDRLNKLFLAAQADCEGRR